MDIYWIADKKKCGPATVPDVLSLVQMGELTPETKGWHAGCEQWMPLRELPALADFLAPPPEPAEELPPPPSAEETSPQNVENSAQLPPGAVRVYLPSAAQRLLARLVDISLYMALVFGVVYAREIPFNAGLLPSSPLVWIGYIILEASLISYLGTTPGKSLLGIQVRCVGAGQQMGLGRSFSRAVTVFVAGMGMMISILPLFTIGYSWWTLRSRGITLWDARCSTLPFQLARASLLRHLVAVGLLFVCINLTLQFMLPWYPAMIEAVEQQSPETAEWMRSMAPPEQLPAAPETKK